MRLQIQQNQGHLHHQRNRWGHTSPPLPTCPSAIRYSQVLSVKHILLHSSKHHPLVCVSPQPIGSSYNPSSSLAPHLWSLTKQRATPPAALYPKGPAAAPIPPPPLGPPARPSSSSELLKSQIKTALRSLDRRPVGEEPWWRQSREESDDPTSSSAATSSSSYMDASPMSSSSSFSYDDFDSDSGEGSATSSMDSGWSSRTQDGVSYNNKGTYEVRMLHACSP